MVDLIKEQYGFPVNSEGEIVAVVGTGGRSVVGALPSDNIPVDANGNMVVNLQSAEGGSVVTSTLEEGALSASVSGVTVNFSDATTGRVVDGISLPAAPFMGYFGQHKCSLIPELGPYPNFTRDTSSGGGLGHVKNHLGMAVRSTLGESLFWGARRVENLTSHSNTLTNAVWTLDSSATIQYVNDSTIGADDGTTWELSLTSSTSSTIRRTSGSTYRAMPHVMSVELRAGTLTNVQLAVWVSGGADLEVATVIVGQEWARYYLPCSPTGAAAYVYGIRSLGTAGTVLVRRFQFEEDYAVATVPSEYISKNDPPLSKFWHGAAVDGVKYFDTALGNTGNIGTHVVTEITGALLTTCKGIATFPTTQQQITNNDVWTGWSVSASTLALDATIKAPDGTYSTYKLAEDTTASSAHRVVFTLSATMATYDDTWNNFNVFVKHSGDSTGREWMRLSFTNIAGTTNSAYFNAKTGVIGVTQIGTLNVEPWGNSWYRVLWTVPMGAGTLSPQVSIGLANGDNLPTYDGVSKYNYVWCPNFTTRRDLSGTANLNHRPIAVPPVFTGASVGNTLGQSIEIPVSGVMGRTNFGAYSDFTPYYKVEQTDKQFYSQTTGINTASPYNVAHDMNRTGITIRPPMSGGAANAKFAYDFYNGDPNPIYFWKANTVYELGDYCIPPDTKPNNTTSKNMYTCVVAGTSGSSAPTFVTTYTTPPDTTSNLTADGTVRWQCNIDNGISGFYECYSGAELLPSAGFMAEYKAAWMVKAEEYYAYINGTEMHKQSVPIPLFPSKKYTMDYPPETLFIGKIAARTAGLYPEATVDIVQAMPQNMSFHKNIAAFKQSLSENTIKTITQFGIVT